MKLIVCDIYREWCEPAVKSKLPHQRQKKFSSYVQCVPKLRKTHI